MAATTGAGGCLKHYQTRERGRQPSKRKRANLSPSPRPTEKQRTKSSGAHNAPPQKNKKRKEENKMKKQEILATVLHGGYIEVTGGGHIFKVYDPCGQYAGRCVWATAQAVLQEPTVKKINTGYETIITTATSRRASEIENRDICRLYAEELEQYADGMVHRCTHCGTVNIIPEDAPQYCCEYCHAQIERDAWEQLTMYDYLTECFDIEYRIGHPHL